ncbi:MAG: hypothetical protein RIS92_1733 [Verrucomicrobiota bacterium]
MRRWRLRRKSEGLESSALVIDDLGVVVHQCIKRAWLRCSNRIGATSQQMKGGAPAPPLCWTLNSGLGLRDREHSEDSFRENTGDENPDDEHADSDPAQG